LKLEAVIFDLGGTLIEYAGHYDRWPDLETPGFMAAYNYLKHQNISLPNFLKIRDTGFELLPSRWGQATSGIRNLQLVDLLAEVFEICGVENVSLPILNQAAEFYQAAVTSQASPLPHAKETLIDVKNQGYKIGLVSNTMFTGAAHQKDLERFGLIEYFDTMLFSADVNKWKPNPDPFLHVLEELGVAPNSAVYLGDDPASDVVGGHRAGMVTIHIKSSQRFGQPDGIKPFAQILNLPELLPILSS